MQKPKTRDDMLNCPGYREADEPCPVAYSSEYAASEDCPFFDDCSRHDMEQSLLMSKGELEAINTRLREKAQAHPDGPRFIKATSGFKPRLPNPHRDIQP